MGLLKNCNCKNIFIRIVIAPALLLTFLPTYSEEIHWLHGSDLLKSCKASLEIETYTKKGLKKDFNFQSSSWCTGVLTGLYMIRNNNCPPNRTFHKLEVIVIKYLEKNPEKQKLSLKDAVHAILADTYPKQCSKFKYEKKFIHSNLILSCKFNSVYNNVNGEFKKVKNPTWPPFVNKALNHDKDWINVKIDIKNRRIKIGDSTFLDLLSYEKKPPNSITSNIRGYLLNTSADRSYLEAFIINTYKLPYKATYFDAITGNIILGFCK